MKKEKPKQQVQVKENKISIHDKIMSIKDDENDLALKGIKEAQIPRPYALMYQIIPKSKKDVEHIHLDMVFALEADDSDKITAQYKEVHDVRWVTRKSLIDEYDTFDSVRSFARNMLK